MTTVGGHTGGNPKREMLMVIQSVKYDAASKGAGSNLASKEAKEINKKIVAAGVELEA